MMYRLAADGVLAGHLAFVLFVLFGALLAIRWPSILWAHLAAVAWGALVEFTGMICPLTPLEVKLRQLGGAAGYRGDFISHYITATLYPAGLTRTLQIWLGLAVLAVNAVAYGYLLARRQR